ncbi:MAG: PAS domain S-box protein, partial [Cyclobacteriaceae bacterium]|nr:PAS domain S-box protein [Cyclobacteriaceae bacterium]
MESKWYLKEVENIILEDTKFEKSIEDILVLVSTIFDCKFAYFSVFDNSAEYFASTVGFEGMKIPKVSSPSIDLVKKGSELTVIEDFNNQRKFQEHPLIKFFPDVIICVGVPIVLFEKSIGVLALGVCEEILNGEVKFNQLKGIGRVLSELLSAKILSQQSKEELSVQRHTNQIFDSVLKSMSEGVFAVDLTGKVVLYNQSAAELLGVDATNLEPEKWSEFYQCHYSDTNLPVPTEELPIIKAMTKGITSYKEFNIINRAVNRKVTLAVSGNPIMDSLTNVVVGGVAIFSDLTEIKRERNILNQAFNSAVDAIIMINEKKEVNFFNDSAEKIFGYKREEVIGENVNILIPEPYKSEHDSYVENNLRTGINKIIGSGRELLMNRKDGAPFWGHMSLGKIDVGNEVLFTAFIKDISEQVKMRNNLKEKHNELMALVESAPVALAMLDNEVKYMAASQKWLEDYGLQGREIIGKCHYDVFPEIGQEWKDIHSYALEGNIVSRDEDSFPRADGSTQWLKWVVRPWTKENGKIGGLIFLTEDISKRREAEIKLREAKETAEKISREKDMFLSNMSHEIRTPLNAINGISQILYSNNPRSDQKEFIDTLKLSSSNLLMIINDVLDYAKLGSGTLQLFKIDFKLFDVIHDIIDINRLVAKEKGIKLEFRYDNRIPAVLSGDNMRLSQVINNLLSNAIKFTSKGHVKVSVEFVSKDEQQVNVKITVEDTGIGIREEDREKIFEQFQQADYSITRQFGGTGLGLSISQS